MRFKTDNDVYLYLECDAFEDTMDIPHIHDKNVAKLGTNVSTSVICS